MKRLLLSMLLLSLSTAACGPQDDVYPVEGDACHELFHFETTSDGHPLICLLTTNRWIPTQWVRLEHNR